MEAEESRSPHAEKKHGAESALVIGENDGRLVQDASPLNRGLFDFEKSEWIPSRTRSVFDVLLNFEVGDWFRPYSCFADLFQEQCAKKVKANIKNRSGS